MTLALRTSWLLLLLSAACSLDVKLPEGRIACSTSSDCPARWSCRLPEGLCYRGAEERDAGAAMDATVANDAQVSSDASALDANTPPDASTFPDASEDASASDASADASEDAQVSTDAGRADASTSPPPSLQAVVSSKRFLDTTQQTNLTCLASDPLGAPLQYAWTSDLGSFTTANASSTQLSSSTAGLATPRCTVSARGTMASGSTDVHFYPADWVALYRFQLDTSDSSGHGNDGKLMGGVYGSDRAGNTGSALTFDGNTSMTLPNGSTLTSPAWSFVATVKPTPGAGGTLIAKGESAGGTFAILLYPDNDPTLPGRLQYFQESATSVTTYSTLLGSYSAKGNKWFQLAVTHTDTDDLRIYIDGMLNGSALNAPTALQNGDPVTLGTSPLGNFTGTLDEVQLYNRALTAAEVKALTSLW